MPHAHFLALGRWACSVLGDRYRTHTSNLVFDQRFDQQFPHLSYRFPLMGSPAGTRLAKDVAIHNYPAGRFEKVEHQSQMLHRAVRGVTPPKDFFGFGKLSLSSDQFPSFPHTFPCWGLGALPVHWRML